MPVGNALANHPDLVREFSDALAERADVLGSIRETLGRCPRGAGAKANAEDLLAGARRQSAMPPISPATAALPAIAGVFAFWAMESHSDEFVPFDACVRAFC